MRAAGPASVTLGRRGREGVRRSDTTAAGGSAKRDTTAAPGGAKSAPWREPPDRRWVPRTAAVVAALLAVVNLLAVASPNWHTRLVHLVDVLPGVVENASTVATTVAGVLLLFVANGLARRKHQAWVLSVVLLSAALAVRLLLVVQVHWHAAFLVVVSAALLAFLVAFRHEFSAVPDWQSPAAAGRVVALAATVAAGAGTLVVLAREHASGVPYPFGTTLGWAVEGLVGIPTPLDAGNARLDDLMYYALLGLGVALGLTLLYLLLRTARPRPGLAPEDEVRIRALLERHGDQDSLGYFALRPDKSAMWSPSGKACVTYRVVSGVMLASGDPLGDVEAWPAAMHAFLAEARRHAWLPAVAGCGETAAVVWRRETGLEAFEIGDEGVVEVDGFSLDGRSMRNVRQMVNRIRRAGYVTAVRPVADLDPDERAELLRRAADWRDGPVERGYSMALGRLGAEEDPGCVVVTAHLDGRLAAFLHLVPWGEEGLSLDLMRRDRNGDPGLNDLLIVTLLQQAPTLGVARVSLNFAVFRAALERGERIGATPVSRAWRRLLLVASRFAQIESLYRFNAKFRPRWQPRFLMYAGPADLARVTLAYLRAEGFLVPPWAGRWPRRGAGVRSAA